MQNYIKSILYIYFRLLNKTLYKNLHLDFYICTHELLLTHFYKQILLHSNFIYRIQNLYNIIIIIINYINIVNIIISNINIILLLMILLLILNNIYIIIKIIFLSL